MLSIATTSFHVINQFRVEWFLQNPRNRFYLELYVCARTDNLNNSKHFMISLIEIGQDTFVIICHQHYTYIHHAYTILYPESQSRNPVRSSSSVRTTNTSICT